MSHPTRNWR